MIGLWARYYRAQIKLSLAVQFQYRVAMAIWMLDIVLSPMIYLVVWTTVAQSSGGTVNGFTPSDFAAYYTVLMIVQHITQIWHMWEYEYLIREGGMAQRLLRPLHPINEDISQNISYKILMLMVLIPAVLLFVLLFRPAFHTPLWSALAFIPAVLMGAALAFVIGWTLAMAAFWTTRIVAINSLYFTAMLFFAGYLAPLDLLPRFMQMIAGVLPFRWMMSFPVELALGRVAPEAVLGGFAAQALWIVFGVLVLRRVWKAAVRRFSSVGG